MPNVRSSHRLLSVFFGAVAIALGAGCGSSGANAPTAKASNASAGNESGGAAAERCIAIADAKRARRSDEPEKVSVKHVLVKYAGAKKAPETVTRTREEACLRAQEARGKLEQGTDFAEIVKTYSEEPGAASREGSIGSVRRADVVPPFADAAFELKPGETSHVVETDYGFHVIVRTE